MGQVCADLFLLYRCTWPSRATSKWHIKFYFVLTLHVCRMTLRVDLVILRRSLRTISTILRVSTSIGAIQNAQDECLTPHWSRARPKNGFSRFAEGATDTARDGSRDFRPTRTSPNPPSGTCATPHDCLPGLGPFSAGISLLGAPRTPRGDPTATRPRPGAGPGGREPHRPLPTHGPRMRREHALTHSPEVLDRPAALQPALI